MYICIYVCVCVCVFAVNLKWNNHSDFRIFSNSVRNVVSKLHVDL